jgi:hypothetical protein
MLVNYTNLENINEFRFLQKKQTHWYLCKENEDDWEKYGYVEDIDSFLLAYIQFSKISESKIINLNYFIDSSENNIQKLFFNHIVSKKYSTPIRLAYKILINQKKEIALLHPDYQITQKKKIKLENIETDKIKFIVRIGSVTEIYFMDNSISYVYETVKVLAKQLLQNLKFFRTSRGCIINIECISFVHWDTKNKLAELKIGTHHFKISRRMISNFKIQTVNIA